MYLQKFEVKNKTALVTGAGKGLGKACAIALAEVGANLIILSRTKTDLTKVEKQKTYPPQTIQPKQEFPLFLK